MTYRFNGFRVDAVRRLLFGADGEPIPLKPRVFDTLLYLVEHRGELLDKRTLLEAIWPNVVVEENNLNQAISTLRRVLGETRDEHRFIVTEPGRGYRFVASVEPGLGVSTEASPARAETAGPMAAGGSVPETPLTSPGATRASPSGAVEARAKSRRRSLVLVSAAIAATCALAAIGVYRLATVRTADIAPRAAPPNSVAVLPLDNLSPDPEDAYFAVGIHEEILNQLTKLADLRVASRTSVQGYAGTQKPSPEIARELNVETVLDGSVRYMEGRVLVTMHLSDGATNESMWSQSYERELKDIFAIQSDIALKVAQALKAKLLPAEQERVARAPTTSLPAYVLYLQAVTRYSRGTNAEHVLATADVQRLLELDPDFTAAWVLYANLRTIAQFYEPERGPEHRAQGAKAARRALELDPELGTAHAALGFALITAKDWMGGEAAFREALRRNVPLGDLPGYAWVLLSVANFAYAREYLEETRKVNPEDPVGRRGLMWANAALGEWDRVRAEYDSGARLFAPWPEGHTVMMHLSVGRNELDQARAIPAVGPINTAMIASLEDPQTALRELHRFYADPVVASPPNARRDIAFWAGHFGDATLALDAIRSAVTEQGGQAVYLWVPQLKEMRQLPEFKALLRDIGIVAYWDKYGWPDICRRSGRDDFDCD